MYSKALEKNPLLFCGVLGLDGATCSQEHSGLDHHMKVHVSYQLIVWAYVYQGS